MNKPSIASTTFMMDSSNPERFWRLLPCSVQLRIHHHLPVSKSRTSSVHSSLPWWTHQALRRQPSRWIVLILTRRCWRLLLCSVQHRIHLPINPSLPALVNRPVPTAGGKFFPGEQAKHASHSVVECRYPEHFVVWVPLYWICLKENKDKSRIVSEPLRSFVRVILSNCDLH